MEYSYTVVRVEDSVLYTIYRDGKRVTSVRVCPIVDIGFIQHIVAGSNTEKRVGYQLEAGHRLAQYAIKQLTKFEKLTKG